MGVMVTSAEGTEIDEASGHWGVACTAPGEFCAGAEAARSQRQGRQGVRYGAQGGAPGVATLGEGGMGLYPEMGTTAESKGLGCTGLGHALCLAGPCCTLLWHMGCSLSQPTPQEVGGDPTFLPASSPPPPLPLTPCPPCSRPSPSLSEVPLGSLSLLGAA